MSTPPAWNLLQRYSALSRMERRLFVRASLLLPVLRASLRFAGFRRTQSLLDRWLPKETGNSSAGNRTAPETIAATARMVRAAGRYGPGRVTCLEESLALWWLLGRQGIFAQLRIGIRKQVETFEAHAWVECGSTPLGDAEEVHRHYAAFDESFPSESTEAR
jgi:hypothetical protein